MGRWLYIILILFLASCGVREGYPVALLEAERLSDAYPDSARMCLDSVDVSSLHGEALARYGLLTLRVNDKLWITHRSDSLALSVVDFYDGRDPDRSLEAYYLLGRVYRDMDDPLEALKSFRRALEVGEGSRRYDILGRVYEQQFYVYYYQDLYPEALDAVNASYKCYRMQKDSVGMSYALRNRARIHVELHEPVQRDSAYQAAARMALEANDTLASYSVLDEYVGNLIDDQCLARGRQILSVLPDVHKKNSPLSLSCLARIYNNNKQFDSARYYFMRILEVGGNRNIHLQKYVYESLADLDSTSDIRSAFRYERLASACQDSILRLDRAEAIKKYDYQRTKIENQALQLANARKWTLIAVLVAGVSFLLLFFLFLSRLVRKYRREASLQREQGFRIRQLMQDYRLQLDENHRQMAVLQRELERTDSARKELVEELNRQKELLERRGHDICKNIDEQARRVEALHCSDIYRYFMAPENHTPDRLPHGKWEELCMEVDRAYPDFTRRLLVLCPSLNERDLWLCCATKIGVFPTDIAYMFGYESGNSAVLRKRLYNKIHKCKDGSAKMFDSFIAGF